MPHHRVQLRNTETGDTITVFVTADQNDDARSAAIKEAGEARWSVVRISEADCNPQLPRDADDAVCESWLRQFITDFGMGFHPDTPASEYVDQKGNRLDPAFVARLDESLERMFSLIGDERPYEIGVSQFYQMMGTADYEA